MIIKSTLSAIRKDWLINLIAIILLSLLFSSELSMYHYLYYRHSVIEVRNNTNLAASTYVVTLKNSIDRKKLDTLLEHMPDNVKGYEDIAICYRMNEDVISTDLICFYKGMSKLHDFRSTETNERLTDKLMITESVMGTVSIDINNKMSINGKEYRLVQCIQDLNFYADMSDVFCCSSSAFWTIADKVDRIYFEYRTPLDNKETDALKRYINQLGDVDFKEPDIEFVKTVKTVEDIAIELVEIILFMFLITTCVLPIIRYCLWKRHSEFAAFRVCGADQSFISKCELVHVLILGMISVFLGTIIMWNSIQTRGFWMLMVICIFMFNIRVLIEVIIDSRSSSNIAEVNKKWRL